ADHLAGEFAHGFQGANGVPKGRYKIAKVDLDVISDQRVKARAQAYNDNIDVLIAKVIKQWEDAGNASGAKNWFDDNDTVAPNDPDNKAVPWRSSLGWEKITAADAPYDLAVEFGGPNPVVGLNGTDNG